MHQQRICISTPGAGQMDCERGRVIGLNAFVNAFVMLLLY